MFRFAAILAATLLLSSGCSRQDEGVPPTDAASEVSDVTSDADVREGSVVCNDPDFPYVDRTEWRHLAELDPCAPAFVARDPAKSAPAWKWIPCKNGTPNCEEFEANWRVEFPGYFGGARAGADADGRMDRVLFMRVFDDGHPFGSVGWEEDLYEISSGKPLAVTRSIAGRTSPPVYFDIGRGVTALEAFWSGESQRRAFFFGSRTASELSSGTPFAFSFRKELGFDSCFNLEKTISTTLWACSDPAHRHVARMDLKTGALVAEPVPRPLHLITVHGDDPYFRENRNALGWARVIRFDKDGTLHPLRDPGARHITSFATDGKTMFWLEAYGDSDPYSSTPQPNVEVWSAPYTNDDATLASTAKRLATLERSEYKAGNIPGSIAVAFDGEYVVATGGATLQLVRASDGRTKVLRDAPGPMRTMFRLIGVHDGELWLLTEKTGTNQLDALARIRLGSW